MSASQKHVSLFPVSLFHVSLHSVSLPGLMVCTAFFIKKIALSASPTEGPK